MTILIKKETVHGEVAIAIENNKVYTLLDNAILTSNDDMSVEAIKAEDWVLDAFLNMQIQEIESQNTVDEEFNKLAEMLD